jgi:hypothetical protein
MNSIRPCTAGRPGRKRIGRKNAALLKSFGYRTLVGFEKKSFEIIVAHPIGQLSTGSIITY